MSQPPKKKQEERVLFVGNLVHNTPNSELSNFFEKYGVKVTKVDVKGGFGFIFFDSEHDARECKWEIDGVEYQGRPLRIERVRGDGQVKRREEERRSKQKPCQTLFVVNFDEASTSRDNLRKAFERYGTIDKIEMRRNYAFITFSNLKAASRALNELNGSQLNNREITVEFSTLGTAEDRYFRNRIRDRSGQGSPDIERDKDRNKERQRDTNTSEISRDKEREGEKEKNTEIPRDRGREKDIEKSRERDIETERSREKPDIEREKEKSTERIRNKDIKIETTPRSVGSSPDRGVNDFQRTAGDQERDSNRHEEQDVDIDKANYREDKIKASPNRRKRKRSETPEPVPISKRIREDPTRQRGDDRKYQGNKDQSDNNKSPRQNRIRRNNFNSGRRDYSDPTNQIAPRRPVTPPRARWSPPRRRDIDTYVPSYEKSDSFKIRDRPRRASPPQRVSNVDRYIPNYDRASNVDRYVPRDINRDRTRPSNVDRYIPREDNR